MSDDDPWRVERDTPDDPRAARIARYRRHADQARQRAASIRDLTLRQQLLDIARQYEILADSIERLPSTRGS